MPVHNSCGNAVRCTTGSTEGSPAILSSSDLPSWLSVSRDTRCKPRRVASHRDVRRAYRLLARDRLLIIRRRVYLVTTNVQRYALPDLSNLAKAIAKVSEHRRNGRLVRSFVKRERARETGETGGRIVYKLSSPLLAGVCVIGIIYKFVASAVSSARSSRENTVRAPRTLAVSRDFLPSCLI